jgi:carbamoyl-phosphate synthase large subunit
MNLLFTSVGRRVSLIRSFRAALQKLNMDGHIVTVDMGRTAPAAFVSDIHEVVPKVTDPSYIDSLLNICMRHQIKVVIPLIDTELEILSIHKSKFEELGVTLLASSPEVMKICSDKRNTGRFFREIGVGTPVIYDPERLLKDSKVQFPLLIKPADGSSSKGVTKIRNHRELEFFIKYIPNAIVQEFVTGQEYTIDVWVDFSGKVRSVVPRMRIETRAGEVSKGMTVRNHQLMEKAKYVVESLPGAVGCITVQCFITNDQEIKFTEINPRFGGGFPLSYAAGADFPKWILQDLIGEQHEEEWNDWKDGVVMLRYDEEIIVTREDIL